MQQKSLFLLVILVIALLSSVLSFQITNNIKYITKLYASTEPTEAPPAPTSSFNTQQVVTKKSPINAKWIPIGNVKAPALLDGSLAGDVGFDPLRLAKTKKGLFWMREAEVKHSRLAMLAAAGWPLSELYHKQIASVFGLSSILATNDRAPSILNGGLSNAWAEGILVMSVLLAGILEGNAMNSGEIFYNTEKPANYVPGNLKFDPLGLYNKRSNDKRAMETAEIKNGRLAMIAITAFAFQEFVTKLPVVQETPFLF